MVALTAPSHDTWLFEPFRFYPRTPITTMLQLAAKLTSGLLGRESRLIRSARPAYESLLDRIYKNDGLPWMINGIEYRIDPHHRHRLGNAYDPSVARFLRPRLRNSRVLFDIGANVGVYVLQFTHWSGPSGRVIAFEPNPGALKVLESHVKWNRITDRVTIVPDAVGGSSGIATLHAVTADGMSRLNSPNSAIADRTLPLEVRVVTLDDYIRASGFVPDALMVDIEGFEIEALTGARRLIQDRRELLIVIEMHPQVWSSANATRQSAEALLDELQLTPVPLQGQPDALADHGIVYLKQRERSE